MANEHAPKAAQTLRLQNLRHDLRPNEALLTLDALDIAPGQMVVLTGPSGSGKTTLLYLLSGLLVPTSGRIDWQGRDIARLSETARDRWRRENASFVFQDFQLVPELSPLDNVLVPAWFSSFSAALLRDRAGSLLSRFGVPDRRRAALLSRGEQQRVALARALLLSPAVIFADEPTASLDAASGSEVITTLSALARDEGHSIIIASHDPALIARADLRLELERGQKVTIR